MVFFTCNACGESLKKAQVDKHVNMCRGCQVLSCIDCGKDFWGEDYKNHIKCITEDQKYGGKGYEAKSNKGDVKQQQWIERIHEAMNKPGISAKMKDVLTQVSSYDNVPRKKAKFQNWMKNSLKISSPALHDQVWEIFSAATSNAPEVQIEPPQQPAAEVEADCNGKKERTKKGKNKKRKMKEEDEAGQQNGHGAGEEATKRKKKKSKDNHEEPPQQPAAEVEAEGNGKKERTKKGKNKKRKMKEEDEAGQQNGHGAGEEGTKRKKKKSKDNHEADGPTSEAAEEQTGDTEAEAASNGKFNWKGTIRAVLRQSPEEGLPVKRLRKKVLAAYSVSGEAKFKSKEDLLALFNKKINNNPKFRVLKDKVRLVK